MTGVSSGGSEIFLLYGSDSESLVGFEIKALYIYMNLLYYSDSIASCASWDLLSSHGQIQMAANKIQIAKSRKQYKSTLMKMAWLELSERRIT